MSILWTRYVPICHWGHLQSVNKREAPALNCSQVEFMTQLQAAKLASWSDDYRSKCAHGYWVVMCTIRQPIQHSLCALAMQGIRIGHDEFKYADGSPGSRAREVFTSLESGTAGQDCNGHGTAVASTVGGLTFGPAKNATLLAVRSLECLGNGTVSQVSLAALDVLACTVMLPYMYT